MQSSLKKMESESSPTLTRDTYQYLLEFADDRTIVNALLMKNKQYNSYLNEDFFKKLIQHRYPLLTNKREEGETWKRFYLRVVHYLGKLMEEFEIPYIPHEHFEPQGHYKWMKELSNKEKWNANLFYATDAGNLDLVKYFIRKGADANAIGKGLSQIARLREDFRPEHMEIFDYLFVREPKSGIYFVISNQNLKLIRHILENQRRYLSQHDLNRFLEIARFKNDIELMLTLINLGAE